MAKASELRELDDDQLVTRLDEAKQELFNLRFQLVTGQLDNTARMGQVKRGCRPPPHAAARTRDRGGRGAGERAGGLMADTTGTETTADTAVGPDAATTAPPATDAAPAAGTDARENRRKVREGVVSSTSMEKTAVVKVVDRVRHPRYAKTVQRTSKLYVHDERGEVRVGDRVRVQETRPLSRLKRWRLVEILERAK